MRHVTGFKKFLTAEVNPDQQQLRMLSGQVKVVRKYLARELRPSYRGAKLQGSFVLNTTIKPTAGHNYDADVLVYLRPDKNKDPKDYINEVYDCFMRSDNYQRRAEKKTRCITLTYAENFQMDIVPCIVQGQEQYIFNHKENCLELTNGAGYRKWFHEKALITNGNLMRVTRLLKYIRNRKENFEAPSILLTTLIAHTVNNNESKETFKTIPDTLLLTSKRLNAFLQATPEVNAVRNPESREIHFTNNWEQPDYDQFRKMFGIYTDKIIDAYHEKDPRRSLSKWQALFGDGFGKQIK